MVNCKPILFILKTYTAKLPRSGRKKKNIKQRQPTSTTKKAHCATHSLSHSLAVSVSLWSLQNSYNLIKRLLHNFFESDFRFLVLCTSRRLNWMRFMLTHTHRGRARETRGQNEWLRTERMGKNIYISTTESERWTRGASKKISKLNYKILSGKLFGKTKFLARVSLWFDHYFFLLAFGFDSWWRAVDFIPDAIVVTRDPMVWWTVSGDGVTQTTTTTFSTCCDNCDPMLAKRSRRRTSEAKSEKKNKRKETMKLHLIFL